MKYLLGWWFLALGIANFAVAIQTPGSQLLQSAGSGALIVGGFIFLHMAWTKNR